MSEIIPIHQIFASDEDGGIGLNGGLPWNIPGDWEHFLRVATAPTLSDTRKKIVWVMGRESFEDHARSGGLFDQLKEKRKPDLIKVVLSKTMTSVEGYNDVYTCQDFDQVHEVVDRIKEEAALAFNIGGVGVYRQQLEQVINASYKGSPFKIFWTKIHARYDCDRFYPITTLEKALTSSFVEIDTYKYYNGEEKELKKIVTDDASGVAYSFHCYQMKRL